MTTSLHDVELLSAYLDGQLNPSDSARLEARLGSDDMLRSAFEDLRSTRGILREMHKHRAPRNFVLSPQMAGVRPPLPRSYPVFRFATIMATFLFLLTFAVNDLAPVASPHFAAAPVPALGMGGAGPAAQESAPAVTGAPPQPFSGLVPSDTGTPSAAKNSNQIPPTQVLGLAPAPATALALVPQSDQLQSKVTERPPIAFAWQLILGSIALFSGAVAWLLYFLNRRKFHARFGKQ